MKKVLFITAFFALAACSEDVYQDIDKHNEILEQSSNAPGNSGGIKPFTSAGTYESPWHFSTPEEVNHFFHSPLPHRNGITVRVTPYIGLAYWDGGDDGTYNTPSGSYNLAGGGYPNLYNGGNEYGNYIQANPIVLNMWGASPQTVELGIIWGGHCPIFTAWTYTYNWHSIFFDVMNNHVVQPSAHVAPLTPPLPAAATFQEALLLNDYGKVMYYKVEFGFATNPNLFTQSVYVLALEVDNVNTTDWDDLSITDTFGGDLYYSTTGSREIVVDPNSLLGVIERSGQPIAGIPPYGSPTITTWYTGPGTGHFVWLWIE